MFLKVLFSHFKCVLLKKFKSLHPVLKWLCNCKNRSLKDMSWIKKECHTHYYLSIIPIQGCFVSLSLVFWIILWLIYIHMNSLHPFQINFWVDKLENITWNLQYCINLISLKISLVLYFDSWLPYNHNQLLFFKIFMK